MDCSRPETGAGWRGRGRSLPVAASLRISARFPRYQLADFSAMECRTSPGANDSKLGTGKEIS
jgi:hypothetical protein